MDAFVIECFFYSETFNVGYYAKVEFINKLKLSPMFNQSDIDKLISIVNNGSNYPYDAVCVDIDALTTTKGILVWGGEVEYTNKHITIVDPRQDEKKETVDE